MNVCRAIILKERVNCIQCHSRLAQSGLTICTMCRWRTSMKLNFPLGFPPAPLAFRLPEKPNDEPIHWSKFPGNKLISSVQVLIGGVVADRWTSCLRCGELIRFWDGKVCWQCDDEFYTALYIDLRTKFPSYIAKTVVEYVRILNND